MCIEAHGLCKGEQPWNRSGLGEAALSQRLLAWGQTFTVNTYPRCALPCVATTWAVHPRKAVGSRSEHVSKGP